MSRDDGIDVVLDAIAATGLLEIVDRVEVEHDPATHQLRVIGHAPSARPRERPDVRHYEVVLRPRSFMS
jgi:hypothetical protein